MLLGTWSYGKEGLIGTPELTSSVWIQAEVETQRGSITVHLRSQPHTLQAHDPAAFD